MRLTLLILTQTLYCVLLFAQHKCYPIYAESKLLHPNENNIYFDASNKHDIRSHFYAPKKYFAGHYYDTYFINLFVILGMTIICLIALYYNLLKKLINGIQDLAFKLKLSKG